MVIVNQLCSKFGCPNSSGLMIVPDEPSSSVPLGFGLPINLPPPRNFTGEFHGGVSKFTCKGGGGRIDGERKSSGTEPDLCVVERRMPHPDHLVIGIRVHVLGFRVGGSGFRVQGSGFRG